MRRQRQACLIIVPPGTCHAVWQRYGNVDGLASADAVVHDTPLTPVQVDEAVEQRQGAAAFVIGARALTGRTAAAMVVHANAWAAGAGGLRVPAAGGVQRLPGV